MTQTGILPEVAASAAPAAATVRQLAMAVIHDRGDNVRGKLGDVEELAASIGAHGVIQSVVLRPCARGGYELTAGFRRYAASTSGRHRGGGGVTNAADASGAVAGPVAATAEALMVMLRARFGAPEWALFPRVRNAAGVDAARTSDAIAVGLWPSRGCEWDGFEVKVSRGDWIRELRIPAKAEGLVEHLDRWWVVVSDWAVIRDVELPPTWGLLVSRGRRLVQVVEAPLLGKRGRPLDRRFVAAVMKRAAGVSSRGRPARRRWRLHTAAVSEHHAHRLADPLPAVRRDPHPTGLLKAGDVTFELAQAEVICGAEHATLLDAIRRRRRRRLSQPPALPRSDREAGRRAHQNGAGTRRRRRCVGRGECCPVTTIEWTCNDDGTRGRTWNPITGCDRISPGGDRCYAMREAPRLKAMGQPKYQRDGDPRTSGPGFGLALHPRTLAHPLRWRRPTRIFVCSMADLFHAGVPATYIEQVWDVMARDHWHTFQVLTKRAERMERVVTSMVADRDRLSLPHGDGPAPPLPNVWLGVSVESPPSLGRIRHLTRAPAAVRFLSCEPLLAPLPDLPLDGIDWVIVGRESGPGARRMELDWVRDIRDRCRSAGVALFVKQMGSAWARGRTKGNDMDRWPPDLRIREMPHQGGGQRCVG